MKVLAVLVQGSHLAVHWVALFLKLQAAPTVGSSIEAGIAYPLSTGLILQLLVAFLLQTCIFLRD